MRFHHDGPEHIYTQILIAYLNQSPRACNDQRASRCRTDIRVGHALAFKEDIGGTCFRHDCDCLSM